MPHQNFVEDETRIAQQGAGNINQGQSADQNTIPRGNTTVGGSIDNAAPAANPSQSGTGFGTDNGGTGGTNQGSGSGFGSSNW